MKMNPVAWFEIYVNDMSRARKFYEDAFGFEFQEAECPMPDMEMLFFPCAACGEACYGAPGALVKHEMRKPSGEGVLIYFHSMECGATAEKIKASGGTVCCEKMSIGQYGFIVLAQDTEGNSFGVHSMV